MPEIYSQTQRSTSNVPPTLRRSRSTHNPLAAFLVRPTHAHVGMLEEDEQVLLILRQHPLVLLPKIILIAVILGIGMVFGNMLNLSLLPMNFVRAFEVLWLLFMWGLILEALVSWYFNVIVITDERVIDVDFLHLIYTNVTVAKLDNIEDVTYSITGVVPSIFNYGNVLIQTAGEVVEISREQTRASIEIINTPHPEKVVNVLNELLLQEEQEKLEGRAK